MKKLKRIHPVWKEFDEFVKNKFPKMNQIVGKYQWIFSSEKGEISLIYLPNYFNDKKTLWEIYSNNTLFEDVQRFSSQEQAEIKIKEILD